MNQVALVSAVVALILSCALTTSPVYAQSTLYSNSTGVGIGTTSPVGALDAEGGTAAASTNGNAIKLMAQNAGSGNQNGGNIILIPGTATGTGTPGYVGIGTASPVASLDLSQKTDALALPVGSTTQEPSAPVAGMIRYNSQVPQFEGYINDAWATIGSTPTKVLLTATTNFYVSPTGSDSNPCTATAKCLTINHALNYVQQNYDLGGQTVNINVADGTYTTPVSVSGPFVGGIPNLIGDVSTPANCIISTTSANALVFSNGANINIGGFKVTTTTNGDGLDVISLSSVNITGAMNFGAAAGAQIVVIKNSQLNITANYTISGSTTAEHMFASFGGLIYLNGITITLSGSPALGTFYYVHDAGNIQAAAVTYSGSAGTTTKYSAAANGLLDTNGGCSSVPGTGGSTASQGQCL